MIPRAIARPQAGCTMSDMLVVAAVIGLITAGLLTLLVSGQQTYVVGPNRTEAQQTARLVLFRMGNDVRTGGHDPKATALFPAITALTPPQVGFTIWNDWNANEVIDTAVSVNVNGTLKGEQITYDVTSAGTILRRQESVIDTSPVTVTDAFSSVTFRYLDADDAVVANPHVLDNALNIRSVEITVLAKPDSQGTSTSPRVSVVSVIRARVRNR
jgi:Tfp pilus assembly protein PilW